MPRSGLALLLAAACAAAPRPVLAPPDDEDDPAAHIALIGEALTGYRAAFILTWKGARIGEARETFDAAAGGYRFQRVERIVVRRADAVATASTRITVELDGALRARRVLVNREAGGGSTRAEAFRVPDDSWRVVIGGRPRLVDGSAVPAALVPLLVGASGAKPGLAFRGPVLVEGAGLALAELEVTLSKDGEVARASLHTALGPLRAEARLDPKGFIAEAGVGASLASRRVDEAELLAPFDPPEVVDSSAVAVADAHPHTGALRLVVVGVAAAPPRLAEIPDQSVEAQGATWQVTVRPAARPTRAIAEFREVQTRTRWVAQTIQDDLGVTTLQAEEALAAGRGDCTAHAMVLKQDLDSRGFETRLVTGFVLDAGALRRHRWVTVKVGLGWIPVDPTLDEAPATPSHLALAVHGDSPDELAFVDDVAFAGWHDGVSASQIR